MAPIDVVPQLSTSPRSPVAPLSSPHLRAYEQIDTFNTEQFKELLKAMEAMQTSPAFKGNTLVSTKDVPSIKNQPVARASNLEFKEVSEM